MEISLTPQRTKHLNVIISQLLTITKPSIRFLAKVIGTIISTFSTTKFGPLHYRDLEKTKVNALRLSKGNFDYSCTIDKKGKSGSLHQFLRNFLLIHHLWLGELS